MTSILVAGGAGYIGAHVCVELIEAGFDVVVVDDLSNSRAEALERVTRITGRHVPFVHCAIQDVAKLQCDLPDTDFAAAIHLAARKSVPESVATPMGYYENNVTGALAFLRFLEKRAVRRVVFSSSATVYQGGSPCPMTEQTPLGPTNPYGWTKLMVEQMLRDLVAAERGWSAVNLRYFNPVGAHPSGLIGEDPLGPPGNLFPAVAQAAVGARAHVQVFGTDYPTADGTGVRDYVHVVDLARAHVDAVRLLLDSGRDREWTLNLGTGRGYSVLEVLKAWEVVCGRPVPHVFRARRPGDVATAFADPALAEQLLGWRAQRDLATMCRDHFRWQKDGWSRPEPSAAREPTRSSRRPTEVGLDVGGA